MTTATVTAACVGHTDLMYADTNRQVAARAIALCDTCPIINQCRRDHTHEEHGVWYGTLPTDRGFGRPSHTPKPDTIADLILDILRTEDRWVQTPTIRAQINAPRNTINKALRRLELAGTIVARTPRPGWPNLYRVAS